MKSPKKQFAKLTIVAVGAALVFGCSKTDGNGQPVSLNDATSQRQVQQSMQAQQSAAAQKGDKSIPLSAYQPTRSGNTLMFAYLALTPPPIDYEKVAASLSRDYRDQNDEFKKRDLLNSLKPGIDREITKAKEDKYYYIGIDSNPVLGKYDFDSKSFPVNAFDSETSYRYFYDNSDYKLQFSNSQKFKNLVVASEEQARTIESLRSKYNGLDLRVYYFANDTILGEKRLNAEIMKIQVVDSKGNVLAEM